MFCTIWYRLYNFKNVKNTHGGMSLLVKLHAYITHGNIKEVMSTQIFLYILTIFWSLVESIGVSKWKKIYWQKKRWYSYVIIFPCITKSNNPRWVFFTFLNCTNGIKSSNASNIFKLTYKIFLAQKVWSLLLVWDWVSISLMSTDFDTIF